MNKIGYLDGLRGCAAIIVVLHHFAAAFYPATYFGFDVARHTPFDTLLLTTPLGLLVAGNFSVCLFFTVGGYVLSAKYFRTGDPDALTRSALRRYFRLLPPVFFSMAVACLFMKTGLFRNVPAAALTGSDRWLSKCWAFDADPVKLVSEGLWGVFFDFKSDYNNVLWTMSYEMYGALLILAGTALFGSVRHRWLVYAAAAALLFKTYYLAFLLGLALSDLNARLPRLFPAIGKPAVAALISAAGVFLGTYPTFPDVTGTAYAFLKTDFFGYAPTFYHTAGAFLVVLAVLCSGGLQWFFSRPLPLLLGRLSFSLYLVHVLVIGSLSCALFLGLAPRMDYNAAAALTLAVTIAVSLAAAAAMDRYVAAGGVRLARAVEKRVFP